MLTTIRIIYILLMMYSIPKKTPDKIVKIKLPENLKKESITLAAPSVQIFNYIKKYSKKYNIPIQYALTCAKLESSYNGPKYYSYNPYVVSYAKAYGVMQLKLSTAQYVYKKEITEKMLLYDLELNIKIAMKYLRYLYDKKKNWLMVFASYNRGPSRVQDIEDVNDYAIEICLK